MMLNIKNIFFSLSFVFVVVFFFHRKNEGNKLSDSTVFRGIYKEGKWGGGSGGGSLKEHTIKYRELLQSYFNDDSFQSFVDSGCGDFQIMKVLTVPLYKKYIGIDVVDIINANKQLYNKSNYQFIPIENLREWPLEILC